MDSFETPYEDEASTEFIECTVCDKSIRGISLYKIHLTTAGHLKKEDALIAEGHAVREQIVPVFEDILQYLDYLNLDEPVIGLNHLKVTGADSQLGPSYTCKICLHTANLPDMVHHVIGRKHRQKYLELERPDLVTWDKQSIMNQGGKVIRARAEIVERQDGRGCPIIGHANYSNPMKKKSTMGKFNKLRVPPGPNQSGIPNIPSLLPRDMQIEAQQQQDSQDEYPQQGKFTPSFSNKPPFRPEDTNTLNEGRQAYQQEPFPRRNHMGDDLRMADDRQVNFYGQQNQDPDYQPEYEDEYLDGGQERAVVGGDAPWYNLRVELPLRQTCHTESYPDKAPAYRKPYHEKDPLKEFYSEEVRRGQVRSAEYQLSQPNYSEDNDQQWPPIRGSSGHRGENRAGRQELIETENKRRNFPTLLEDDHSHQRVLIRDYQHERREPHPEELVVRPGPSRAVPSTYRTSVEVNRNLSDIPEPFRRFLKGSDNDEGLGKRKRKSRFSDATAEEVETAKRTFHEGYGPSNPKFGGYSRPGSVPYELEDQGAHHPDRYMESESCNYAESNQRQDSDGGSVLDMLNNIDIENAEEAEFLKSKLCNLLKEFKAKKSARALQGNQRCSEATNDSERLKPSLQLPKQPPYERTLREDSDIRRRGEQYFEDDQQEQSWRQRENVPDERQQGYNNPMQSRTLNRSRYEEVFGRSDFYETQPASYPNQRTRPSRFSDLSPPCDYPSKSEEVHDSNAAPLFDLERGPRMQRGPRYNSNLDKITSTLLELVARK